MIEVEPSMHTLDNNNNNNTQMDLSLCLRLRLRVSLALTHFYRLKIESPTKVKGHVGSILTYGLIHSNHHFHFLLNSAECNFSYS